MENKDDTVAGGSKPTAPSPPVARRKGCMPGKGGPENCRCPYHGVRQRTWGKWVAEIREPDGGARVWLGSFETSIEAARAYDAASLRLYGASGRLNLAESHPAAVRGEGCEVPVAARVSSSTTGGDCSAPDYEQEASCLWDIPAAPTLLDNYIDPELHVEREQSSGLNLAKP